MMKSCDRVAGKNVIFETRKFFGLKNEYEPIGMNRKEYIYGNLT